MITISTHVLDTSSGEPARGVGVTLHRDGSDEEVGAGTTDDDGRIQVLAEGLAPAVYRLRFDTGGYGNRFFPHVDIVVSIDGERDHYHIPLLLSPFGYTTYRGS